MFTIKDFFHTKSYSLMEQNRSFEVYAPRQIDNSEKVLHFIAGGVSSVISKTATAPLDRAKLVLQCQQEMIKTGRLDKPYGGILDCVVRIYENEGFVSLWRGNIPNVARYFVVGAMNFGFNAVFLEAYKVAAHIDSTDEFFKRVAAYSSAGVTTHVFGYSLNYSRTRMANDVITGNGQRQYSTVFDVYKKALQSDGIRGLHRGIITSYFGTIVYRNAYFLSYDFVSHLYREYSHSYPALVALSYGITVSASFACYPFDTISRRAMMRSGEQLKYPTTLHCLRDIIMKEGVTHIYKGFGANMLRSLGGTMVLLVYDKIMESNQ